MLIDTKLNSKFGYDYVQLETQVLMLKNRNIRIESRVLKNLFCPFLV
jgi:hypothetical protein